MLADEAIFRQQDSLVANRLGRDQAVEGVVSPLEAPRDGNYAAVGCDADDEAKIPAKGLQYLLGGVTKTTDLLEELEFQFDDWSNCDNRSFAYFLSRYMTQLINCAVI